MQMCHSDVDTFRKSVGSARSWYQNINCRISFPFRNVLILYISQESQDHSIHVDFESFKLALWPTLRQKLWTFEAFWLIQVINMMKRLAIKYIALRLPRWSKLTILPWVSQFFNFSHNKTPNLMVFSEISFWNEMFLCSIKTEMFTVTESLNWLSLCIKTLGITSCTMPSARDFATVLRDTFWPYILQIQWNELKYGFYCQNPACFPWIYLSILHK